MHLSEESRIASTVSSESDYGSTNNGKAASIDSPVPVSNTSVKSEAYYIFKTALPLVITFLLQSSLSTTALFYAGRLGAVELGGISIGNVTFAVTSAIFIGIATCLDTVCPQAFGAGNYEMVGLYFQRGVAISLVCSIPITAFWYKSDVVLSLLVKDSAIVTIAATYLRIIILTIPGFVVFECGKKYLQAQGDFITGQNILFLCAPLNVMLNYLFVIKLKLGYIGSPIAIVIVYSTMGFSLIGHIYYQVYRGKDFCWHPITKGFSAIFTNWKPLLSLALPGVIMLEAEFFAFEIITILSAGFGTQILAAQSIVATIQTFVFQLPFSCSVASSNRIAYHVGSGNITNCKVATKTVVLGVGTTTGIINFVFLYFGRFKVCSLFSNDPNLVKLAASLLKIVAINQVYDVFNVMAAGVLRAQGRQRIGGYLNIIAYYVVGLEIGALLAYYFKMQVKGLWLGLGLGILTLAIGENSFVYFSNWVSIVRKSKDLQHEV